jgi:DNA-binding GntR family transcriptional regulator
MPISEGPKRSASGTRRRGEPQLAPLTHLTLFERVYGKLSDALTNGVFAPGETLTIRGLAEQLGTSVMPAREALRRLAAEGALDMLPNRSIRVPVMDATSAAELCRLRMLLEGEATAIAAARLTPEKLQVIRGFHRDFESSVKSGNVFKLLEAGQKLHFAIYEAAESPKMFAIIQMLWLQSGPSLAEPMRRTFNRKEVVSFAESVGIHHQRIIDALGKADADRAARAVRAEIAFVVDHVRAIVVDAARSER